MAKLFNQRIVPAFDAAEALLGAGRVFRSFFHLDMQHDTPFPPVAALCRIIVSSTRENTSTGEQAGKGVLCARKS